MKRNIWIMMATSSLLWGRFFIPVLALFYVASQVSLEQFGIIMGAFSLAILLLEIPSGVVADLLGKKKAMIISTVFYIVEIYILAFHFGFWAFLIAKLISAVGVSLSSGTSGALFYDTLKKLGREDEHKKLMGRKMTFTYISMAITFIVGGILFNIDPKLPAIVSLVPSSIALVMLFFLKEPYKNERELTFKNSLLQLKEGVGYVWDNKKIMNLIMIAVPVGFVSEIALSYSSAYLQAVAIPVAGIGIVAFAGSMIRAYASKEAHVIEKKLGEPKSLMLIFLVITSVVFLMSTMIPYYGMLFLLILYGALGFYGVIMSDYTNRLVKTSHRATMLSVQNMFVELGAFVMFFIASKIVLKESIGVMLFIVGVSFMLVLIFRRLVYGRLNSV